MVAAVLIGAVIAILGAMAAREYIVYKDFPKKFNGISTNEESVLVHMKGPKNI